MTAVLSPPQRDRDPKPLVVPGGPVGERILVPTFAPLPFAALVTMAPIAWEWGPGWINLGLTAGSSLMACLGISVGYHRYSTHRAVTAWCGQRIALVVAGGMAALGPVTPWVADHRRYHAFADRAGDPHLPGVYGIGPVALAKGFWRARAGWLDERVVTNTGTGRWGTSCLTERKTP